MEIKFLSETSVPAYQTRWHNIPQDLSLQSIFVWVCVISNTSLCTVPQADSSFSTIPFPYFRHTGDIWNWHSSYSTPSGLVWLVSNCSYFSAKLQGLCASCSYSKWNLSLGYADIFSIHLPIPAGLFLVGKWLEGFLDLLGNILDPVLGGLFRIFRKSLSLF